MSVVRTLKLTESKEAEYWECPKCKTPATDRKACMYCIAAKQPGFNPSEKTCAWCTATDEARHTSNTKECALYGKYLTDLCGPHAKHFAELACEECGQLGDDGTGLCDDCEAAFYGIH